MHLLTSSILCAVFTVVVVDLKEITTKFHRSYFLDGFKCPGTKSLFNFMNFGKVYCAKECSKTFTCIGIFFVPTSGRCIGCSSQFDARVTEPLSGSTYYDRNYKISYLGCYYDAFPHRILDGPSTNTDTMTNVECANFCITEGNFTYALTELGNECFCSNKLHIATRAIEGDCATPCTGNPIQTCGGSQRGSVYLINY